MSKHIKTINGRKYYYKSIRKGDKVTSEYIGPVERIRRKKPDARVQRPANEEQEEYKEAEKEDDYIG